MSIYSKRNVWCAIVLYFALVQVVIGETKYCLKEVDYCFTITLPQANETLVNFRLEAPSTAGWLGVGVGPGMDGYLMVVWITSEGKTLLSQRVGEEGVQPMATDQQADLNLTNSTIVGDKLIIEFTRPLKVKTNTIKNKQTFAYAYATINPESDDIVNVYLPRHDYRGNVKLDLEHGDSELQYDKLIIAHASLMSSVWFVLIPGAIFIARFARNLLPTTWFKLHVAIQLFLSTPIVLAGSVLSFVAAEGLKFDDPHRIIGFVLFLGFFIQLAIGAIHHHLYDPKRNGIPWWTKLHWWFGRSLVVLAAFQVPFGLKLFGVTDMVYYYIYYIYLFVILIAFSFLSFRLWNRRPDNEFKRMEDS
ncbi:hypothetical protein C1645_772887 [Glomus cerebriforme]|uniref:Cytochrome b561 domain-containing protein n=1 Tax=Glomus cerebriforme TaxID=658196 RepID=A0A397T282_9GLOM|nr:hypothetical protein C1645_772887 [Glomus cerebriforme]